MLLCTAGRAQLIKPARSSSIVAIDGRSYYVHEVKKGETVYSLSKLYGVQENDIVANNPQLVGGLQADQVIKIPVVLEDKIKPRKMSRLYEEHVVNQGETAYGISRRYGISVNTLMEDNPGLDPTQLAIGQKLNIRKKSMGEASEQELAQDWKDYTEAASSVSDGFIYHLVAPGETVFSLSRQFDVTQFEITKNNDLKEGLKAGQMVRIPDRNAASAIAASAAAQQEGVDSAIDGELRKSLRVKAFKRGSVINVAMLLPLRGDGKMNPNFLEFYQGALLALEDLKSRGVSVEMNLYNTDKSDAEIKQIIDSESFKNTDLIIGPVYEEGLEPVLAFASRREIPVVSPLAEIRMCSHPLLFQMSPDPARKYEKLHEILSAERNVVVISAGTNDAEFEREIKAQLPVNHKTFTYGGRSTPSSAIEHLISRERENVFVVLAENEYTIDEILARISSVQNNLIARSARTAGIMVIGTPRWARFTQADKNLFFKLGVHFIAPYHADRSDPAIASFDKRYVSDFGTLPNPYAPYAYRAYDAVKLFVGTAGEGTDHFEEAVNSGRIPLLQMSYRFGQSTPGQTRINTEWALVGYQPDYSITVQ